MAIKTTYSVDEQTEKDDYRLEITVSTNGEDNVIINVIHKHYDGKTIVNSEGMSIPYDTFVGLIGEIWKAN